MNRGWSGLAASRWAPYAVAGVLLLGDFLWLSRGLAHANASYQTWGLDRGLYSDIIWLSAEHYLRGVQIIHPVPYLHDRIEYPVLLGFTLWLPTWLPAGPASWFAAAGVMTTAATFGSLALIRRHDPRAVWWIAVSPALLLDGAINWDLIGILFLVGGVVWFGEGRLRLSGASTAVGTFFKLFPVVVAPVALAALGSRWWRSLAPAGASRPTHNGSPPDAALAAARSALVRWLVPFAAVSAAVMVPFLIAAPSNTLWFFRFNSLRPQKDSIWELGQNTVGLGVFSNHAVNVATLVIVVAAMAYAARMVWRIPEPDQARAVALGSALLIIVWMAVNKVWNPQYVLWVFAAGALVSAPARFGLALGAISVYDSWFEFVLRRPDHADMFTRVGYVSVVARSVLFVLMAAWLVGQLRRLQRPPEPAAVDDAVHSSA